MKDMETIVADPALVAHCGLYCGACGKYLRGRCPGCHDNAKATWCAVRSCTLERHYASCAECADHPNPRACRKFHNPISRVIGFVLRSDRPGCIAQIKELGLRGHAERMASLRRHSIER